MPEVAERKLREPQSIFMSLVRGKSHLHVRLEPADGEPDPFRAINTKTNKPVKLQQRERLSAYAYLQIPPPDDLIRGIQTSRIIRNRETKPPPLQEQSLVETS